MLRVELGKLIRRPRTWITVALLAGLPAVVAVFVDVTGIGPRPGEGPALLSEVLDNGLLMPAAALALILPIFLPVAVAVIAGDAIAGEAEAGTLRYLLVRPVPRTTLLVAKLATIVVFIFLAVALVAAHRPGGGLVAVRGEAADLGVGVVHQHLRHRLAGDRDDRLRGDLDARPGGHRPLRVDPHRLTAGGGPRRAGGVHHVADPGSDRGDPVHRALPADPLLAVVHRPLPRPGAVA